MKKLATVLCLVSLLSCSTNGQINTRVLDLLKGDLARISPHKLIFSEVELIEFCKDSIGQKNFSTYFRRYESGLIKMKEGDVKEFKIIVEVIYNNINSISSLNEDQKIGKSYLLKSLEPYRVNFIVNEALLVERFDGNKRGLIHGDDECSVSYSKYIFLIHNPLLYRDVMQKNKSISKDGVVYLPLKCTLKEDDGLLVIREVIKTRLMELLSNYKDPAFDELKKRIKESSLEETHD